jgi:hypothetical protein
MVAYDLRKAWKGPAPGLPDIEVHVEAASLAGKLTAVKVVYPWTTANREPPQPETGIWRLLGPLASMGMKLLGILFGLILAARNLRLNRGDKKGAFRLAIVTSLLVVIRWVAWAHHVGSLKEWDLAVNAVVDATSDGLLLWILYIALEPMVRSRWPHALVTWNRLLAGRIGDAQLGAHILIGAAIGLGLRLGFGMFWRFDYLKDGVPTYNSLMGTGSALGWIGSNVSIWQNALEFGFIVFFAIFGFRVLWKNDYLAALSVAILYAATDDQGIWNRPNPWAEGSIMLVIFAVLALVLLRMGMVSTLATIIFINTIERINVSPRLTSWYVPYGFATMALLIAVVVYAFWRSIGTRTLGDAEAG